MKRILSYLTVFTLLFTTALNIPCYSFIFSDRTESITLPKDKLEELQRKIDELDKQINPTTQQKLLDFTNKSVKNIIYYLTLASIAAVLAEKAGYVKLPKTFAELKNVKINSQTGVYAFLGFLAGSFLGSLGNLFGITDLGFLIGPATVSILSMYKTGEDPINKTFEKIEVANNAYSTYSYIRSWF